MSIAVKEKRQSLAHSIDGLFLFSLSDKLKFAIKVSLSIMLAYMIPFSQGWDQGQTAAIAIMLIATAGPLSESVVKGIHRVIGSIIGAMIGMTLIALFPQERELYLLSLSIAVTIVLYLARAYKADMTIFMLTAMTMMLVFKGGEVDDIFLYGIDRTMMTVFGVTLYTFISLLLWPAKPQEDNILESDPPSEGSKFLWFDLEHLKASLVTFMIFWTATLLWIYVNPPGGFLVVALATGLSVITTFTPVKPSLLMIVFTFSFLFAIAMYILVLPHLLLTWEFGLFLFFYAFIGFYFIPEKVSIFFLLGIATLMLNNPMNFYFNVFLLVLFMFYLFLSILLLAYYFPFSTKPEHLFLLLKQRFLTFAKIVMKRDSSSWWKRLVLTYSQTHLMSTVKKMQLWESKIDFKYFDDVDSEALAEFIKACESFVSEVQIIDDKDDTSNKAFTKCENMMNEIDFDSLKRGRF